MAESLKHFVLRSEARKLFRSFAKTARRLPTRNEYSEVMAIVRQEFSRHQSETDLVVIEDALMYGHVQLKSLQDSVHNMVGGVVTR